MLSWLLLAIALAGCLQSAANDCANSGVCPPGLRCGMAGSVQVCVPPTCGNGQMDSLEVCDDSNNISGDGCPADCTAPCGDGILDPGEACDDGDTIGDDGCSADCRSNETCGNAFRDPAEVCDDGGVQSYDGCSSRCTVESPAWASLDAAPAVRSDHAMVYDPVRGAVVLFGGNTAQGPSNETWTWDGSIWRRRTPVTAPPARAQHAMAYDAARQRVVMFGGSGPADDGTWEWDGRNWVEQIQHNPFPPPQLVGAAMVYDATRKRVVLFGGATSDGIARSTTWAWDGSTWRELSTNTPPSARVGHTMVYDGKRNTIVLFGGFAGGKRLDDTWELDGVTWTQRRPSSAPAERAQHAMIFDAARGKIVLFGGDGALGTLADTWEWDGTQWAAPTMPAEPPGRFAAGMAYDVVRRAIVLFGGQQGAEPGGSNDTWEWDGGGWTRRAVQTALPPPQGPRGLFYDVARSRIVLVGVYVSFPSLLDVLDVWEWDGTNWLPREVASSSSPRGDGFRVSSDGTSALLFGGEEFGRQLNDTWVLSGSQWVRKTPSTSPSWRQAYGIAYDPERNRSVLFGGQIDTQHFFSDTWEWDGSNWTQASPVHVPSARHDPAMAYNAGLGHVVMFGGATNGPVELGEATELPLDDTWVWNGRDWIELASATRPPARMCHAMAYDPVRGRLVLFGGFDGKSLFNDTWEWDGVTWLRRIPTTSPPAMCGHVMAFDPRWASTVVFDGRDLWEWDGTEWHKTMPDRVPMPRARSVLAYDPLEANAVLFGGEALPGYASVRLNDTWVWNGMQWRERISGVAPKPRADHAMALDPRRRRFVMFGGAEWDRTQTHPDGLHRFDDTWEWDGSAWSERIPAHRPVARQGHAMVYDEARRKLLMFGGSADNGVTLSDQWEWDGDDWTNVTPAVVPPPRASFGITYDAARQRVVLFGGKTTSAIAWLNDVWEWDGTSWTQRTPAPGAAPVARSGATLVYDPARRRVVMFGGQAPPLSPSDTSLSDVWEWDGTSWTQLAVTMPSARHHQTAVYDAARGGVVMFGGNTGVAFGGNTGDVKPLGDSWVFRYEDSAIPDEDCHTGFDVDGDGQIGCTDPDCSGLCTGCGDGICSSLESCRLCPDDCGSCQACGDLHCDPTEDCSSCPGDCGSCQAASREEGSVP